MPWFDFKLPWSDTIKKKVCRYLLQRYLGQFLEEKLKLEQLNVDFTNGKGNVENVTLSSEVRKCKRGKYLIKKNHQTMISGNCDNFSFSSCILSFVTQVQGHYGDQLSFVYAFNLNPLYLLFWIL